MTSRNMNNKTYTLYTARDCKWCKRLAKSLIAGGFDVNIISIRHNTDAIRFLQELNLYTVPQLFEDNRLIGGYEDAIKHLNLKG